MSLIRCARCDYFCDTDEEDGVFTETEYLCETCVEFYRAPDDEDVDAAIIFGRWRGERSES